MTWNLIICEGPHDQEFLCSILLASGDWMHEKRRPRMIPPSFTNNPNYTFLASTRAELGVAIAGTNGVTKLLGIEGLELARSAATSSTTTVIIDSDDVGVPKRQDQVRAHFSEAIPSASAARSGEFAIASPNDSIATRFGLWVAPNCKDSGSLDSVIRRAAATLHPKLENLAASYIGSVESEIGHDFESYFDKAVAGTVGQRWKAGASLASSLQARDRWVTAELLKEEWLSELSSFVQRAAKGQ